MSTELALAAPVRPQMVEEARDAAERAQKRAGLHIRRLDEIGEQRAAAAVWQQVWDRDGEPPVSAEVIRAAAHAGNYVSGAFIGDRMVGALLGFYAGEHGADHVHSHILGVDDSVRGRGVGFALKLHQRLWALQRGLTRIVWTYDPLVRGNGFFNLAKLGAVGVEYLVDFYGEMSDTINGGDESDRVLLCWELTAPRVVAASSGVVTAVGASAWRDAGAAVALESNGDGGPRRATADSATLLCRVPDDILALRRRDPRIALAWRRELREVTTAAMSRGLRLQAMTSDGWYVLAGGDDHSAPAGR